MEPANNNGERAIRPGVRWRKVSFGTHSVRGSRFAASMLTVMTALKQQERHVLDDLTAACQAALCDEPAPSLIPEVELVSSDHGAA
ncbi:MAG: hypothetical protein ETSY2_43470 [Candidatus Entotheonella gemina]|uniref:Uncharacterized protein n=1 Tax=Candidatus Entotheonella gemina TaxID=1429439 RepID=W4LJZ5_9BACT|nr:MAG: hypothetical protein ETSY2_43470 [Candidatus Entotheonella gemina]